MTAYHLARRILVGATLEWAKSFPGIAGLLPWYVEHNGQTLSDAQSIFNGQVILNLNGVSGGTQRFLRGSITSGTTGGAATHTHTRGAPAGNIALGVCNLACPKFMLDFQSNNPPNYELVYIFCVK